MTINKSAVHPGIKLIPDTEEEPPILAEDWPENPSQPLPPDPERPSRAWLRNAPPTDQGPDTRMLRPKLDEHVVETFGPLESDPTGRSQHEKGAKLDAGKARPGLVMTGFAKALSAVIDVGTYGANKYTDDGWISVPNGHARYTDAMIRHLLAEMQGESHDPETRIRHAAHLAWNALARLELEVRAEAEAHKAQEEP